MKPRMLPFEPGATEKSKKSDESDREETSELVRSIRGAEPTPARPILKWAGGKRQLLPVLRRYYPREFETYFEPFVGSAAVYFDVQGAGLLAGKRVVLADVNDDLIGLYTTLCARLDEVLAALKELERGHRADPHAHYYRVRDERFNPLRRQLRARHERWWESYTPEIAAMLVYLNRTGFNGLFRLNGAGDFNVPIGRYVNPTICDEERLRRAVALARAARRGHRARTVCQLAPEADGRRLRLSRPSVRARRSVFRFHELYGRRLFAGRPASAAANRGGARGAGVPRPPQQLDG